jgi:hypothetical protein
MAKMTAREILSRLNGQLDEQNAPFPERVAKLMTYQAALYLATGGRTPEELDPAEPDDDVDTEELESYAKKLRDLGIEDYAKRSYSGENPESVNLQALKYQYYLYQAIDLPGMMDDPDQMYALKDELRGQLEVQERDGEISCLDTWLSKKRAQEEARRSPLKKEDRSVYEFEASDDVWRDYITGAYCLRGWGARTLTDRTVEKFKESPFDKLTLRNKRTVEHVQRGELDAVGKARRETERSFTFLQPEQLKASQASARNLNREMQNVDPAIEQSREWRSLNKAVFDFQTAEDPQTAAKASAEVLLAVEKFTKGKKNAKQSPEVTQCVNLALRALETTIPGAPDNPSVKPLVDRFNEVRRYRLQGSRLVNLRDNKALSANATDREIADYWQTKITTFVESELKRPTVRNGRAAVSSEEQALEAMAVAVALEEARDGKINIKKDLRSRVEALKQDPAVQEMARDAATKPEKATELAAFSESFRENVKSAYDDAVKANRKKADLSFEETIRQKQEEIRKLREAQQKKEAEFRESREQKEDRFRMELIEREAKLEDKLADMGSDYYGIGAYDAQEAGEVFAELIAIREVRERSQLGIDPKSEWKERVEALKKDPAVTKMAEELPADADFRRILNRGGGVDAVCKTYANGGELPEALRGLTVDELYAMHRENVQRLAGTLPGAKAYTAEQSTLLLANLLAIREQELKGGRDAVVDDEAFCRRVEQLQQDSYVRELGRQLLKPENQTVVAEPVKTSDEPERTMAANLYKSCEKYLPKELPAPRPEAVKPDEIKPEGQIIAGP